MQNVNQNLESLLLIDDDPDEYSILTDALEQISPNLKLSYESTCSGVFSKLENCKPDLIFLDINLPAVSGFECLKEIKESIAHCKIPVVIYSNSQFPKDVALAYDAVNDAETKSPVPNRKALIYLILTLELLKTKTLNCINRNASY